MERAVLPPRLLRPLRLLRLHDNVPPPAAVFFREEEDTAEAVVEEERPPRYDDVVKPLQLRAQQAKADTCNTPRRFIMLACIANSIRINSIQRREQFLSWLSERSGVEPSFQNIEERRLARARPKNEHKMCHFCE